MQQTIHLQLQRLARQAGSGGRRHSAPRSRTMRPRFGVASAWPLLARHELRLMMARLFDLEIASPPGPVRSRFRHRRALAVQVFRQVHGPLADDARWVAHDAARGQRLTRSTSAARSTGRVAGWRLFHIDTL